MVNKYLWEWVGDQIQLGFFILCTFKCLFKYKTGNCLKYKQFAQGRCQVYWLRSKTVIILALRWRHIPANGGSVATVSLFSSVWWHENTPPTYFTWVSRDEWMDVCKHPRVQEVKLCKHQLLLDHPLPSANGQCQQVLPFPSTQSLPLWFRPCRWTGWALFFF